MGGAQPAQTPATISTFPINTVSATAKPSHQIDRAKRRFLRPSVWKALCTPCIRWMKSASLRGEIKGHEPRRRESGHHHRVDITLEGVGGVAQFVVRDNLSRRNLGPLDPTKGEVREVKEREEADREAGPDHRAAGERRLHAPVELVRHRPRRDRPQLQPYREGNVQHEDRQESRPGDPDERTEIVLEEIGVVVNRPRPLKDFQVADHVEDDKPDKPHAGERHEDLRADAGVNKRAEERPRAARAPGSGGPFGCRGEVAGEGMAAS